MEKENIACNTTRESPKNEELEDNGTKYLEIDGFLCSAERCHLYTRRPLKEKANLLQSAGP